MLTESEIVKICRQELAHAQGWDSDELSSNRKQALDYYFNRPRGDELPGRSSIQSSDVADMTEAVLSQISPILTKETLIQFEAAGEEDEPKAQVESDFTAHMVGGQNKGYIELMSAIKDALMLRNGFIRVGVDAINDSRTFTVSDMAEFQVEAQIAESDNDRTFSIDDIEKTGDTFKVQFRESIHTRELKVQSIAPENMLFSADHDTPYLSSCRAVFERKLLTRSELIQMGYSKKIVKDLPGLDVDTREDSQARRQDFSQDQEPADKSQHLVETFEIHIRIDEQESGIADLLHIHLAHNTILMKEVVEWVPYATGSPFIVPHRVYGLAIFDKVKTIQDSKTHFLRQWHDNARRVNNARIIYNPLSTEEGDVLNS